jgi:hypothetical protein
VSDDQAGRVIPSKLLQRMDVVTGGASRYQLPQFGVTEIADFSLPAIGINPGFIGRVPGGNPIATADPRLPHRTTTR